MTTKRGDVVLVQFPRSDLRSWDRRNDLPLTNFSEITAEMLP